MGRSREIAFDWADCCRLLPCKSFVNDTCDEFSTEEERRESEV